MLFAIIDRLDGRLRRWLRARGVDILRIAVGVIFVWFGALKLVPGLSPAEGLIHASVSWAIDPHVFIPLLALWECAIGIGLISDRLRRLTLGLLFAHMAGTFMPLVACPELVWANFPFAWTLEGQYIFKNLVLIAAGLLLHGRSLPLRSADRRPEISSRAWNPTSHPLRRTTTSLR